MVERATLMYGTCVALGGKAALLTGPSGSGKSDLALRFIVTPPMVDQKFGPLGELVADDQVLLTTQSDKKIIASPPEKIAGKIEVRGLGLKAIDYCPLSELILIVELVSREKIERLPDQDQYTNILGFDIKTIQLDPFDCSSTHKLRLALNDYLQSQN